MISLYHPCMRGIPVMARVRFAPSPTGMLHLGGARTALLNFLYAKATGGSFILRIEDTDKERCIPGSAIYLQESLKWLGLHFDEGPSVGGSHGPYVQSEKLALYQKYAQILVESGNAYPCFCSRERLQSLSLSYDERPSKFGYDGYCRRLSKQEVEKKLQMGLSHTIRSMVPSSGSTVISDQVYGKIEVSHAEINDYVLLKSDGTPTYHLSSVVDDHCMEISHVLRGEEFLLSTAKHMLLYSALKWAPPVFGHLPLLMTSAGKKLSKRSNDVFIEYYKKRGFQPEAIINFLAFLGWSPGELKTKTESGNQHLNISQELFSIEELGRNFTLKGINRKPAIVDEAKLLWMNKCYFRQKLSDSSLLETLAVQLQAEVSALYHIKNGDELVHLERMKHILLLLEDRIPFIPEIAKTASYFWIAPVIHAEMFSSLKADNKAQILILVKNTLEKCDFGDKESLNVALKEIAIQLGIQFKQVMLISRVALTGVKESPGLTAVMNVLGKTTVLDRLNYSINIIKSSPAVL